MPQRQTKRKFIFPAVATTSILVTGGIAYWWLTHQPTLLRNQIIGGKVIPNNVVFTVAVTTDLAKWEQLQSYGTPETKSLFNSQIANLKKQFLTDLGYDYQTDIQPWIGKQVLVAVLPSQDRNQAKKQQLIAVLPIADKLKAQEIFLSKPSGTERTYQGVKIGQQGGLSFTVLEDEVIVATSSQGAEIAVDTFLAKSGIGENSAFTSAMAQVKDEGDFANLYLNLPALTNLAIARTPQNFPKDSIIKAQNGEGIVASATLEPERIRFDGFSWLKEPIAVENRVTSIPNLLPADTLMLVSGSSFQSVWQDIRNWSDLSPFAPLKAQDLEQSLLDSSGLRWETDLLPWMKDEFAISLVPKTGTDNTSVGLILMAKASDRSAATQAFSKLDSFAARKYQLKISEAKLADLKITNWAFPSAESAGSHGFLKEDFAFINLGNTVTSQFLPKPESTLANNLLYKLATDGKLTDISSQFFLDLEQTVHPGNLSIPRLIPQQEKFVKAVRGIGLKMAIADERTYRFELSIVPKKL